MPVSMRSRVAQGYVGCAACSQSSEWMNTEACSPSACSNLQVLQDTTPPAMRHRAFQLNNLSEMFIYNASLQVRKISLTRHGASPPAVRSVLKCLTSIRSPGQPIPPRGLRIGSVTFQQQSDSTLPSPSGRDVRSDPPIVFLFQLPPVTPDGTVRSDPGVPVGIALSAESHLRR